MQHSFKSERACWEETLGNENITAIFTLASNKSK